MTIYAIITFRNTHFAMKAKEALEQAQGSSLLVIVSSEESRDNVIRFLKYSGAEIEKIDEQAGEVSIYTKEISGLAKPELQPEDYICETQPRGGRDYNFYKQRPDQEIDTSIKALKSFIRNIL